MDNRDTVLERVRQAAKEDAREFYATNSVHNLTGRQWNENVLRIAFSPHSAYALLLAHPFQRYQYFFDYMNAFKEAALERVSQKEVKRKGIRTWQYEALIAALVLSVIPIIHRSGWEAINAFAVLMSFMRMQIADRHSAASERSANPEVECWKWNWRYVFAGEITWIVSFVHSQMWSSLVGCALFLMYPVWRKYYKTRRK